MQKCLPSGVEPPPKPAAGARRSAARRPRRAASRFGGKRCSSPRRGRRRWNMASRSAPSLHPLRSVPSNDAVAQPELPRTCLQCHLTSPSSWKEPRFLASCPASACLRYITPHPSCSSARLEVTAVLRRDPPDGARSATRDSKPKASQYWSSIYVSQSAHSLTSVSRFQFDPTTKRRDQQSGLSCPGSLAQYPKLRV